MALAVVGLEAFVADPITTAAASEAGENVRMETIFDALKVGVAA